MTQGALPAVGHRQEQPFCSELRPQTWGKAPCSQWGRCPGMAGHVWAGGGSEETPVAKPAVPGSPTSNGPVATAASGCLSLGNHSPPSPRPAPDPQQACRHPPPWTEADSGPHLPPETVPAHRTHQAAPPADFTGPSTLPWLSPRGGHQSCYKGVTPNLGKAVEGLRL